MWGVRQPPEGWKLSLVAGWWPLSPSWLDIAITPQEGELRVRTRTKTTAMIAAAIAVLGMGFVAAPSAVAGGQCGDDNVCTVEWIVNNPDVVAHQLINQTSVCYINPTQHLRTLCGGDNDIQVICVAEVSNPDYDGDDTGAGTGPYDQDGDEDYSYYCIDVHPE